MEEQHENDHELDPNEGNESTLKGEGLKAKGRRVLSRDKGQEPEEDDFDAELDAPGPKKNGRLNLADLSSVDEKDAQTSRKTKVWGFVIVCVLLFALVVLKPQTPAPATKVPEQSRTPQPLTASDVQNYESDLRQKIEAQKREMEMERQRMAQEGSQLSAEDQARLAALNTQQPPPGNASQPQSAESERQTREAEERRKEEASLHASNLAIIGTEKEANPPQTVTPATAQPPYAALPNIPVPNSTATGLPVAYDRLSGDPFNVTRGNNSPAASANPANAPKDKKEDDSYAAYVGKLYRIPEDTIIDAVLVNKLNNSFAGPVIVQVATDVYTHDNQYVLVPAGTRVVGEVRRVEGIGDQRLALSFHRMLMPDLYPVPLDHFQGLNQIGETGLRDKVNHHYLEIFGTSIALGAIAGLSEVGNTYGGVNGISPMSQYRAGFTENMSASAMRILDRYTNILPTFTVREGTRVRIILTGDLMLPTYVNHRLPGDL
ncbi:MAG: TrbI/VirB10 family protein [Bryobacteraceae bacterium]